MLQNGDWRSVAVQIISESETCQGAGILLRADAGVRVQRSLQICLGGSGKSKKCDKQLTFIVRVSFIALFESRNKGRQSKGFLVVGNILYITRLWS
jgi:hypothetical protein